MYLTAYYPQTDRSSKCTNQTLEIALRFYINTTLEKPSSWPKALPWLQGLLNNFKSSTTNKTLNKVAYRFTPNTALDLLKLLSTDPEFLISYTLARDAIVFANINSKYHYNRHHQPMFLKTGDQAFLRLYKGYNIPANAGIIKKLSQQYVGPFKVLARVSRLAYCLDVLEDWRVYPVFTIAQLKPAPLSPDPFDRPRPDHPPLVFVEGDTESSKSYFIDRILNKRTIRKGQGMATEYLIKWKGYGPEYDRWYNIKDLDDAAELVKEYESELSRICASQAALEAQQ